MIPRIRFDIGWRDLLYGFRTAYSFRGDDRLTAQLKVEQLWSSEDDSLACLSLRSGFDTALEAYSFPAGSEVLMSCMNIGPMADIVESHGLTPLPIDLDLDKLTMRPDLLERAITPNTKAIVHAHLLGTRQPLDELRRLADKHGLVLFEDCAQAYRADDWRGDPRCDVTMFSFGPLKTCSATMGGIVRYRDKDMLEKARSLQSQLPVQSRFEIIQRLLLFSELIFVTQELPYSIIVGAARRLGLEEFVNAPLRNFRGSKAYQFKKLRKQPSRTLLSLLLHRLKTYDPSLVKQRLDAAEALLGEIPEVCRPGRAIADHGYWQFPIYCDDPVGLRRHLHRQGFDSTLGHKAFVVIPPPADRLEFEATTATGTLPRSLYLPVHFRARKEDLVRLGEAIRSFDPECTNDRGVLNDSCTVADRAGTLETTAAAT
ncbi:UDP-4-amino-4-deoxy-L-arabinose--oxoglutarate aminotransferase [Botrimarina colliarenosi]|uniref:UDP-4-amino-4-deoxy-L-arabinose--oxoglutarate aminotransferase n=1 Tax=Botrimarina colliarenosi TaxID=2528001 RepID=A0A5C6AF19_9BACT|nr:DegT/DnrJ/EryC1/StrS family aminotransferase [Botrimarina colliarenosi]TWT98007.1 UDP-4-amino-4-deoxy-L-arabinose--oxoglutarate aminotransferase [Botrimarina colliarenosi]